MGYLCVNYGKAIQNMSKNIRHKWDVHTKTAFLQAEKGVAQFPPKKLELQFVVYELTSNFTCISEIGKAQEPKSH